MSQIDITTPVGQVVAQNPGHAVVFERHGIDYCCGGGQALGDACAARGIASEAVLEELAAQDAQPAADATDWTRAPLGELADHIVATHHAYLNRVLPRLVDLAAKTARAHGERHPEMVEVQQQVEGLQAELEAHAAKEEMILFPLCKRLDETGALPQFHCGSVANPIRVMEMEHDSAGSALARIRVLTNNLTAPEDACNTYRALLHGLAELELDLHAHIHKENNILFPRAIEREGARQAA